MSHYFVDRSVLWLLVDVKKLSGQNFIWNEHTFFIQSSTKVLYLTALVYYWLKWKFISKIGAFVWKLNRILPIRLLQSKFKMHAFQHYFSLTLQQLTTLYYNTINFNCLNAKPLNLIKIRVPKHCFSIKTVSDTDDLVFTWWVFCIFLESRISNILAPYT